MKKEAKTVKKVSTKTAKKVSTKTSKRVSKNDVIAGNEIFDTLKPNRKVHLSFGFRVSFCVFSFCLFIFSAIFLIISSIKFENAIYTNYTERGTLDYKIHSGYVTKVMDNHVMVYATSGTFLRDESISQGRFCTYYDLYIKNENEHQLITFDDSIKDNEDFFKMEVH